MQINSNFRQHHKKHLRLTKFDFQGTVDVMLFMEITVWHNGLLIGFLIRHRIK